MSGVDKNLPLLPEVFGPLDPFFHETSARKAGYRVVAGIDEAGRGPLAGPVVACAVILSPASPLEGVQDSKKMTAKAREESFYVIGREASSTGIGVVPHSYIDQFNILRASLEAMRRAVSALDPQPDYLLVDGIHPIPIDIPQKCLIRGDQVSRSISAASVMAKVYRDRLMRAYHRIYPEYSFDEHKGYATQKHLAAIKMHGPCPIHRLTFRGVLDLDEGKTRSGTLW